MLFAIGGCRAKPNAAPPDASVPPPSIDAATEVAAAVSPAAAQQDALIALTLAWNDALAQRNAPLLRRVYGDRVRLYEEVVDREVAVGYKAAAFKRAPDYTQSIRSIHIDRSQPKRPTAEFLKTWRQGGKDSTVRGVLVFDIEGEHPLVVEESDVLTDKKRLASLDKDGCWGLVHQAVLSTASGRYYVGGHAGTIIICEPPTCDTFQVAAGTFGEMAFQREAHFFVDHRTGVVSRGDRAEALDPAIAARLVAACRDE